jgi:hypothetical protein
MFIKHSIRLSVIAAAAFAAASCGDVVRTGRSPVILNVNSLQASGGNSTTLGATLHSDVIVNLTSPAPCTPATPCPTVFNDSGSAVLAVIMKDVSVTPTTNNDVTVNRYHVQYRRADGRNIQGVDVPFAFDGAVTATIPANGTTAVGFEIVRHVAKEEAPLAALITNPAIISTICDVTFFGRDQVGNEVTATGSILIDFGNFGDTQ